MKKTTDLSSLWKSQILPHNPTIYPSNPSWFWIVKWCNSNVILNQPEIITGYFGTMPPRYSKCSGFESPRVSCMFLPIPKLAWIPIRGNYVPNMFLPCFLPNVGKTAINHPPVITCDHHQWYQHVQTCINMYKHVKTCINNIPTG